MGLTLSRQMQFTTMSYAPEGDTPQLALVKAADNLYPLYGEARNSSPQGLKSGERHSVSRCKVTGAFGYQGW